MTAWVRSRAPNLASTPLTCDLTVSGAMLSDKIDCIRATGVEICTSGDNSCLMHIGGGLRRANAPVRALHLAEILATTA